MKTVQVLGSLFVICLVSFNFAASNPIESLAFDSAVAQPIVKTEAIKAEIVKDAVVIPEVVKDVVLIPEIVAPVAEIKSEIKTNVETLITEIMAAVVPTIVASIEQKEVIAAVPEVAKADAVVVIDEALAKKDYLPKSLIKDAEEKVVPAVTEVIAEIVDKVIVPVPAVAEAVVAKTTEETKKSETPLVETVKVEDKQESSTASSSDSSTTVAL
ncbi:unnamed protein product [Diamesa serratosioi]